MEIGKIKKTLFRKYEVTLAALISRIISIIIAKVVEYPPVLNAVARVKEKLDILNAAIRRVRKSSYTVLVEAADALRDGRYRGFVLRIESDMLCDFTPQIAANATILNDILIENGKPMKAGYLDQTNQLENLFKRFDAPEIAEKLAENHLTDFYNHLKEAQDAFRDIWAESVESASNKDDIPTLKEATTQAIDAVNKTLAKRLEIAAEDEGEPFVTVIAMINRAVEETERVQRARLARNDTSDTPVDVEADKTAPEAAQNTAPTPATAGDAEKAPAPVEDAKATPVETKKIATK